jgi:hypothetical protein
VNDFSLIERSRRPLAETSFISLAMLINSLPKDPLMVIACALGQLQERVIWKGRIICVVHENEVGGSSIIWVFLLVIADSEQDMPESNPGPLGWYTSALNTRLQEVRQ